MFIHIPQRLTHRSGTAPRTAVLKHRFAMALAAVTCALIPSALAVTAASAAPIPPDNGPAGVQPLPATTVQVISGGMPGWQITLIALCAALIAATTAVLLDRARAGRRTASTT
jgi:hypothetical protein